MSFQKVAFRDAFSAVLLTSFIFLGGSSIQCKSFWDSHSYASLLFALILKGLLWNNLCCLRLSVLVGRGISKNNLLVCTRQDKSSNILFKPIYHPGVYSTNHVFPIIILSGIWVQFSLQWCLFVFGYNFLQPLTTT